MCVCVHILIGIEPGETIGEKAIEDNEYGLGDEQAVQMCPTGSHFPSVDTSLWTLVFSLFGRLKIQLCQNSKVTALPETDSQELVTEHSKHQGITINLVSEFYFSRLDPGPVTVRDGGWEWDVEDDPPYFEKEPQSVWESCLKLPQSSPFSPPSSLLLNTSYATLKFW